jgi:hypothetical protein
MTLWLIVEQPTNAMKCDDQAFVPMVWDPCKYGALKLGA